MSLQVELQRPQGCFTNLDEVRGRVVLWLSSGETITAVTVKLEGESRSQVSELIGMRGPLDPYASQQTGTEVHKLLYKVTTVFPEASAARPRGHTLSAGRWEWPFSFKVGLSQTYRTGPMQIPFNNNCVANSSLSGGLQTLKTDSLLGPAAHVKRTLPPTISTFPGLAEIQYFIKATVQRPAFYKENYRAQASFLFLPFEPPRAAPNRRESFARLQHNFAQPALFSKTSSAPQVSIDGRLPDPPIITCNRPIPLRLLLSKTTDASVFLDSLLIDLVAYTHVRAEIFSKDEVTVWTLVNRHDLRVPIAGAPGQQIDDDALWKSQPLPSNVSPTFSTCNISRTYALFIKVGLRCDGHSDRGLQTLRMPVDVFSGIAPPQALLNAMSSRPATTQTTDHVEPSPADIPPDAPPSYEDAMAERDPARL